MPQPLPDDLAMGRVALSVRDLERSLAFYAGTLGLEPVERGPGGAVLGAGGRPLFELVERRDGRRDPAEAGLFHVALLLPDRRALGRTLRLLVEREVPMTGAADHVVSEALYLDDPDGHGLELYRDRPREAWDENGRFALDKRPVHHRHPPARRPGPPGRGRPGRRPGPRHGGRPRPPRDARPRQGSRLLR